MDCMDFLPNFLDEFLYVKERSRSILERAEAAAKTLCEEELQKTSVSYLPSCLQMATKSTKTLFRILPRKPNRMR